VAGGAAAVRGPSAGGHRSEEHPRVTKARGRPAAMSEDWRPEGSSGRPKIGQRMTVRGPAARGGGPGRVWATTSGGAQMWVAAEEGWAAVAATC
jgi:hypothetical protein